MPQIQTALVRWRKLLGFRVRLPELRICAVVLDDSKHAAIQVVEEVAMQRPDSGIVSIKSDGHLGTWRNKKGIAQGAGYLFTVDFYNLEIVTMQMHRVSHVGRDR